MVISNLFEKNVAIKHFIAFFVNLIITLKIVLFIRVGDIHVYFTGLVRRWRTYYQIYLSSDLYILWRGEQLRTEETRTMLLQVGNMKTLVRFTVHI